MAIYHKMENALPRAEELLAVDQKSAALQLLYEAIISRHFQHNLLALEPIVSRFLELCVSLRQGKFVKEGLTQYRIFCQATSMGSFEQAVKRMVKMAEDRLTEAMSETTEVAAQSFDDPIVEEVSKMLQARISMENGKERLDRQTVLPWMRFLWEAYRAAIEVCRNNVKLEKVYCQLVYQAFDFCLRHQRKAEMKRLAETLRYHLGSIVKSPPGQPLGINLTGESANADSQQLQLDIRYRQLDVALELELWQEAFRSIEDIHGLLLLGGKSADSLIGREEYFEKVARIFEMSENSLFHAAALSRRYFALADEEERAKVKFAAAVSALAVPVGSNSINDSVFNFGSWTYLEDQHSRASRLSYFLGFDAPPTQFSLIYELLNSEMCPEQDLQHLLQMFISSEAACDYEQFKLQVGVVERLNISSRFSKAIIANLVYIHMKHLERSATSFNLFSTCQLLSEFCDLELLLFRWFRAGDLSFQVDQVSGMVDWIPSYSLINDPSPVFFDYDEPKIMYMHRLCSLLREKSESALEKTKALYDKLEAARRESTRRQESLEKAREEKEAARREREKEEAKERVARLASEQEAEEKRLTEEAARRERDRLDREREVVRKEEQRKKEEDERRLVDLANVRAALEKLQHLSVRFDHIERALRQEELPRLKADYQAQLVHDRDAYDRRVQSAKEESLRQFNDDLELRGKLQSCDSELGAFMSKIMSSRLQQQSAKQAELDEQFTAAKEAFIAEKEAEKAAKKSTNFARAITEMIGDDASGLSASVHAGGKYVPPQRAESSSASGAWRSSPAVPAALAAPVEPKAGKYVPPSRRS